MDSKVVGMVTIPLCAPPTANVQESSFFSEVSKIPSLVKIIN